jgi:hypothetical protein
LEKAPGCRRWRRMRIGWRPAAISIWSFSKNPRNCGSVWQPERAPLRAASTSNLKLILGGPPGLILTNRENQQPGCLTNLQNSTYTTWRDRTWDGGSGHDPASAMTGQPPINGGLGNLAPQNRFRGSLDPAYFQDAALLPPGQELLQQMWFFFRSQVLIIPSSRTGAFQYSFSLPQISGWQLTHRPTAPARCRGHQEFFKQANPGLPSPGPQSSAFTCPATPAGAWP